MLITFGRFPVSMARLTIMWLIVVGAWCVKAQSVGNDENLFSYHAEIRIFHNSMSGVTCYILYFIYLRGELYLFNDNKYLLLPQKSIGS